MERGNAVSRASEFSPALSRSTSLGVSEEYLDGASTTVTGHRVLGLKALAGEHKTHGQVPETLITPPTGNLHQEEQYLYLGTRTLFLLAPGKAK